MPLSSIPLWRRPDPIVQCDIPPHLTPPLPFPASDFVSPENTRAYITSHTNLRHFVLMASRAQRITTSRRGPVLTCFVLSATLYSFSPQTLAAPPKSMGVKAGGWMQRQLSLTLPTPSLVACAVRYQPTHHHYHLNSLPMSRWVLNWEIRKMEIIRTSNIPGRSKK